MAEEVDVARTGFIDGSIAGETRRAGRSNATAAGGEVDAGVRGVEFDGGVISDIAESDVVGGIGVIGQIIPERAAADGGPARITGYARKGEDAAGRGVLDCASRCR